MLSVFGDLDTTSILIGIQSLNTGEISRYHSGNYQLLIPQLFHTRMVAVRALTSAHCGKSN